MISNYCVLGNGGKRNPLAEKRRRRLGCAMGFDQILILAAIQGLTEFIPVSSSGHLVLAHEILGGQENLENPVLDVALHFGTLLAVMVYFKNDTKNLALGAFNILRHRQGPARDAALHMTLATLPVMIAAMVLMAAGFMDNLRSAETVAWASIIFAVPLYLADRYGARAKTLSDINAKPAFLMGLAQMLALIPGASRAGVTLMAGRTLGFSREDAARYSMLMAMPVILAFALFGLIDLLARDNFAALGQAAIGAVLAALFAFVAIDIFLKMTRHLSLLPFVLYRLLLGVAILIFI
jgi:undecaprenyl-diphosphatase